MTSRTSSTAPSARRRYLAVAVTLAAAFASAASLDMAAPEYAYTAQSKPQETVLTVAAPAATYTVHVEAPGADTQGPELVVKATVRWTGDADGGVPEGGAPVVSAVLGPDEPEYDVLFDLDDKAEIAAVLPSPDAGIAVSSVAGFGSLAVAAERPCKGQDASCVADFTLVLSEAPAVENVTVTWTAVVTFVDDTGEPPIAITVTP